MRAVVQRIKEGKVVVDNTTSGEIGHGLLVYLGVAEGDTIEDVKYMAEKLINLRIFEDDNEKMNLSLLDVKGEMLVVSQFTLLGDCRKGRRPNFTEAAKPDTADALYMEFIKLCRQMEIKVETGVFQAHMMVHSINDGPVTILVDSKKDF
ncbi:D-aminoacyl-tRNA deacylase [Alkaliphilus peptidifermentans]|uniref:D-aminoacyl-tRNA deacylase n=1 Tax=Alkaliphilus peptidifermentans DSM 18978 TaxID=1120976 RepID=A0A1G5L447_9FIRM|nr:D-aminoacyl-tRNA deacylase [Alkaliphilus peptidifermentans]SCZ07221.1 D-tyrosyl-tRNA(Tyr) deacylase [Alkaliphilus peptidifermentans DSM 18978]